jgi:hypothetical protein
VAFDAPNISMARNLGLARAAGEIVAFLDDDAVPLPGWLRALTAPFVYPEVVAAGGQVLNGGWLNPEWIAGTVDPEGQVTPLAVPLDRASLHRDVPDGVMTVLGANMAFRRDRLAAIGGFDPALRYYLDETDVCQRLAGETFAVVPQARVQHARAPNAARGAAWQRPDLTEIGASQAVFLRKYLAQPRREASLGRFSAMMRNRLMRQMVNGALEPGEIVPAMETLAAGISMGLSRPLAPLLPLGPSAVPFATHPPSPPGIAVLAGRTWQSGQLRAAAARATRAGPPVVLFLFSPTALFHGFSYEETGFWKQRGGLFGRAVAVDPLFSFRGFGKRVRIEAGRWLEGSGKT